MKNLVAAFGVVCMMAGCGSPIASPKKTPQPVAMSEEEETSSSRSGFTNLKMSMFEPGATQGEMRKPSFRISAGSGEILPDSQKYSLRDVKAIAYSESGEEVLFEAKRADYSEVDERAILEGDVQIHVGVFKMTMQRVEWDNVERKARSESPVVIDRESAKLVAKGGMTIDSASQKVSFFDLEGRFEFEKEKP